MSVFWITLIMAVAPLLFNLIEALKAQKTSSLRIMNIICNAIIGLTSLFMLIK